MSEGPDSGCWDSRKASSQFRVAACEQSLQGICPLEHYLQEKAQLASQQTILRKGIVSRSRLSANEK